MYTVYNYPQQNMLVASQENHPHFLSCIPYDAFKFNNRYSPLKKKGKKFSQENSQFFCIWLTDRQ